MDYPFPPKSPPIFEFEHGTSCNQSPFLPNLDLDLEEEDPTKYPLEEYLNFSEDDLPGAVYYYDNDPLAPTAAAVAEEPLEYSLSHRVRDMGISG
jgi:hypothetical protein